MAGKKKGKANKPADTPKNIADEAANLPTIDELAEQEAELDEQDIDEPARDIVNKPAADDPIDRWAAFNEIYTEEERREIAERLKKTMAALFEAPAFKPMLDNIKGSIEQMANSFNAILSDGTREALQRLSDTWEPVVELNKEIDELEPYIEKELQKPEYNGATLQDLLNQYDLFGLANLPQDSTLYKVLEAAREARAAALPVVVPFRTDELNTPVDKVNFLAFDDYTATDGQLKMKIDLMSESDKRNPARKELDISMMYSLTFDEDDPNIRTTKKLKYYDKRAMQAIDTLITNGQTVFLIGDLFYAMGNKSANPSKNQREKLNESLTTMGTTRLYMNNALEAQHYDYPHVEYDGNVLSFERVKVTMENGQEVEAIHVLKRPPMMELADSRKQMTKIPIAVAQSGISQTDGNLRIEDYLLRRIVQQKNKLNKCVEAQKKNYSPDRQQELKKLRKFKILLATFHEKIGKENAKSTTRTRAEKTAERYLTHYVTCGFIEGYKKTANAFEITLPKK